MVEKNFESEKSSFEPLLPPLVDAKKKKSCAKKESLALCFPMVFRTKVNGYSWSLWKCVKS
jgi:hypothetical protein